MSYTTDLTDAQWDAIEPIFKKEVGKYGNRAKWPKRELVNAVQYVQKTGCQWSMLPKDFPPYNTVWSFFRRAKEKLIWQSINAALVELVRKQAGRNATPSYALIDSQSVKTTGAAQERGIDGGKKRKAGSVTS
jgi:putative transposase